MEATFQNLDITINNVTPNVTDIAGETTVNEKDTVSLMVITEIIFNSNINRAGSLS